MGTQVRLVDVAPRDGIQNEARMLSPAQKIELISRIAAAGLHEIEVTSFVSPRWVAQMADAEEVMRAAGAIDGLSPLVLVVNDRGYQRARAAGARRIRLVVAASETMQQKNANSTPAEMVRRYAPLLARARAEGVEATGVIATAFGCAYEGAVDPGRVLALAAEVTAAGACEIDFADTVGMAVPTQVARMVARARRELPGTRLGAHLHNTRNSGIANAYAALEAGADVLDASTGGAGGCPFAPKATGNIPMEDLVFMLEGMGVGTGVNLDRLIETSRWFEDLLGHPLPAMVMKAGGCWRSPPPLA